MHTRTLLLSFTILLAMTVVLQAKPLKVFILAGQSNMQGHAAVTTLEAVKADPKFEAMSAKILDQDGKPVVCDDVWISNLQTDDGKVTQGKLTVGFGAPNGMKFGPEFTFGIYMHEMLNEPVLIIKTAWGGKSLHTDFRSPSAGPFVFSEAQLKQMANRNQDVTKVKAEKEQQTGHYYRLMLEHVKQVLGDIKAVYPDYNAKNGYEIAGFVWFQGWNDMVDSGVYPQRNKPDGYAAYTEALVHFIKDVRKDLDAPKMPFVIGVMGTGGELDPKSRYYPIHTGFRNAMAAPASMPEFKGNVIAVQTAKCWDAKLEELDNRNGSVKGKMRDFQKQLREKKITREQYDAAQQKVLAETFTDEELDYLRTNKSNFGFHYMGSGKVMTCIGKSFADAMYELMQDK